MAYVKIYGKNLSASGIGNMIKEKIRKAGEETSIEYYSTQDTTIAVEIQLSGPKKISTIQNLIFDIVKPLLVNHSKILCSVFFET